MEIIWSEERRADTAGWEVGWNSYYGACGFWLVSLQMKNRITITQVITFQLCLDEGAPVEVSKLPDWVGEQHWLSPTLNITATQQTERKNATKVG